MGLVVDTVAVGMAAAAEDTPAAVDIVVGVDILAVVVVNNLAVVAVVPVRLDFASTHLDTFAPHSWFFTNVCL